MTIIYIQMLKAYVPSCKTNFGVSYFKVSMACISLCTFFHYLPLTLILALPLFAVTLMLTLPLFVAYRENWHWQVFPHLSYTCSKRRPRCSPLRVHQISERVLMQSIQRLLMQDTPLIYLHVNGYKFLHT